MKKLLIIQIALLSVVVAQVSLRSFIGEKLHYDLTFAGSKVAVIDIVVQSVNDSTIGISFNCETVRWAEPIFNEKDSVYTEMDLNKFQFTYSYRLADWRYAGISDIAEVFLTKNDSFMTYRYEKDRWFSSKNRILLDEMIVVNKDLISYELQEVVSSAMMLRLEDALVGEWLNLYILGSEDDLVGPEIIPVYVESLDTIAVVDMRFETLRCRISVPDDNWLFRKSKINVWVTNDQYHLPLYGEFAVVDSIGLKVNIDLEKSIIPYWNDVKKQLIPRSGTPVRGAIK